MAVMQAVIFDMDGVLIDSVAADYRAKSKVLAEDYGLDIAAVPDPHGERHKGGSITTLLAAIQEHHGVAIDKSEFAPKIIAGVYQDLQDNGVTTDPKLIAFLDDLKAHAVPMAIATSSTRQGTENRLDILGIQNYFQVIITSDDVQQHKPHPEPYTTAMEQLHAMPANTFIFEDSKQGIAAGRASGAKVIGVTNHNTKKDSLPDTILTIDTWSEISYERLSSLRL